MLANDKLAPPRARPVDPPLLLLRPRFLASVETGKTTMASFKALSAAALLSAMTLTPVFAQAAIQEPGLFAFYHPNADVLNGGAPPPEGALASAPPAASEAYETMESGNATFCTQRYRSYDPVSGTFLGYDGRRHRCG
jgi:BA14K-like protein